MPRLRFLALVVVLSLGSVQAANVQAVREGDSISLSNDAISATWSVRGGTLRWQGLANHLTRTSLPLSGSVFALLPKEGAVLSSSILKMVTAPVIEDALVSKGSSKAADRLAGRQVRIELEDPSAKLHVTWTASLRDGANYVRQEITIHAAQEPFALAQVVLIDAVVPGALVSGQVKGSPITAGTWFFGFEHPLSECRVRVDRASCWIERELPLQPAQSVTYSSVIGVTHASQLRRDFLHYVELERAHPYRTFLHYNSWYDLGFFDRYNEQQAVEVVQSFGEHLTKERGVKLDSFLFDDGWDDPSTLWKFNPGFPDGLTKVTQTAAQYGAAPGIWLSPWGGYDGPKKQRIASAQAQGFETNEGGLALSGPKYYRYFRDTCFDLIEKYGVNQFKFDGTGNVNEVIKGSEFDSDFAAAIHLIGELRAKKPDLYINLTTGTYPSPFWLLYADSIWRGGEDHSFAGVGTNRQRWITYRDSQIYRWVVEEGPLFPINSLMLHGMIFARYAERLGVDPGHDFPDEVHSYFGTGTQLQEMYITATLLSANDWDVLAEAAKWSRDNAQTLKDSHWIGGDPARLEVYGWASWSPAKAILTLRNPSDQLQDFTASLATLLELPAEAKPAYAARSPWKAHSAQGPLSIPSRQQHQFHLRPFQVLTLELVPSS
ncbi:MAG TPA: enterotoxin [Candidatus Sulfotelmatobacter sp.]|nr:enterotoxin [Candidatus Sulfotelmatobacter sp.]